MSSISQIKLPNGSVYDINSKTVNGHTVNSDVPSNAKFTDTLRRRAVVGQSSSTSTNPYYKFASISTPSAYYDCSITFKVSIGYGDKSTAVGILTAHFRSSSAAKWESGELIWEYAVSGIDPSKFILAHNSNSSPTVVELWARIDSPWVFYHFDVMTEGTRTTSNDSLWTLYNKSSAGSESAVTSGYAQITSTLGTIKNNISGNAASASKLNSSAGSEGTPVYFKNGVPVACNASIGDVSSGMTAIKAQMPFEISGLLKI